MVRSPAFLVALVLIGCAATPANTQPTPAPGATAPSAAQPAPIAMAAVEESEPTPDGLEALDDFPLVRQNARSALAEAAKADDFSLVRVVPLPSIPGAVLEYALAAPGLEATKGFYLIGPDPGAIERVTANSRCGELLEYGGSYEWDLRGDGSNFVVFNEIDGGAHCSTGSELAYEYVGGRFRNDLGPEHPSRLVDENGDGKPDFPTTLFDVVMGECYWVACSAYAWVVTVEGLETWDGTKYSSDPARFRPAYESRVAALAARSDTGEDTECAREALIAAASIYVYEIILGRPEAVALRDADRLMKGKSTRGCSAWMTEGRLPILTWQEARSVLRQFGRQKAAKKKP